MQAIIRTDYGYKRPYYITTGPHSAILRSDTGRVRRFSFRDLAIKAAQSTGLPVYFYDGMPQIKSMPPPAWVKPVPTIEERIAGCLNAVRALHSLKVTPEDKDTARAWLRTANGRYALKLAKQAGHAFPQRGEMY